MPALTRAMGKHAALQHGGLQSLGDQNHRRGDETVHHDDTSLSRRLKHRAQHGRHFKAAKRGQHLQRCRHTRMKRQHLAQHRRFAVNAACVQTCACAGAVGNVQTSQTSQNQGRCRGVADAHFTQQNGVAWQVFDDGHAVFNRLLALGGGHGRGGG